MTAPHLDGRAATTSRRGLFWVGGDRVASPGGTVPRGPMFVAWEAPAGEARPLPFVLVHGGGGQGTDYLVTPDGRPGWLTRLVEAGYAGYVVDRPGHGRSPYHPDVLGPMGGAFPFEAGAGLFAPGPENPAHTQWPGPGGIDDPALEAFMWGTGPMVADLAAAQALEAERLARLLDQVGPAVLVTHSAGAGCGWLAAQARPRQVAALVQIEPAGPPFATIPGVGALEWGLTAAPLAFDPPAAGPDDLRDGTARRLVGLPDMPVVVVTGGASPFATFDEQIVAFLHEHGCAQAERLHLPDVGIEGNGHGIMLERNSDEALAAILAWVEAHVGAPAGD